MTTLIYKTSAFADQCPHCKAEIRYVQFGGTRVGVQFGGALAGHYDDEYSGFQFVTYMCGANYYFDDRKQKLENDSCLCPSILKDCRMCGGKIGGYAPTRNSVERLGPFCSDQCAIKWARANAPKESLSG